MLREATDRIDKTLVMLVRNLTFSNGGFYSQKTPIVWEEHDKWWRSRNQDWHEFVVELLEKDEMRPIGIVTIGQLDHWSPEIGYAIIPTEWGKGYGKEAVALALEWLKKHGKEYCHTTVLLSNERSIRLLESLGFIMLAPAREGEVWLQKKLV